MCDNEQLKYGLVRNKNIHITDYITKYTNLNKKCKVKCKYGHELICINEDIPFFKHKITDPKPIKKTNIPYSNDNVIVFQNDPISPKEVTNYQKNSELKQQKIIWIINGNDTIKVTNLDYSDRIFLEFLSDTWKYSSFICCSHIFVEINELIYKVSPQNVKSDMIDVEKPIVQKDFIDLINTNQIKDSIDIPPQCNLYIKQQGAGNGKTFGLIQMLESPEFEHYKHFIVVTKQHSAKYVIYKEFKNQISEGFLKHLTINSEKDYNKKYIISYTNYRTNTECKLIVGTIDSLLYTLGNKNNTELNQFQGLVNSIIDGYIEKKDHQSIYYGTINIKLNKEVCLICDETQDLTIDYAKAIIQIMRNKYIDAYIVGDLLQSIFYVDNAFTYLMNQEFPYISKKKCESTNVCRRFNHPELIEFVNSIVPFQKYSLLLIKSLEYSKGNQTGVHIFIGKSIYASENNENKINSEVEKIMSFYNYEVVTNNYLPNDFLVITPFTNKNPLVNALEIAVSMYWNKKYENTNYVRYAVFHKSEEGSSINLSESENATRMVSIHTSKGDGRNVVFVIGMEEQSLIRFSNGTNNLMYDSLIHVALTRMKKKLYIRIVENNDDIYQKMTKYTHDYDADIKIKPIILISKKIKYRDLIDSAKTNEDFESLRNHYLTGDVLKIEQHHDGGGDFESNTICYTSMVVHLYLLIIRKENQIKDYTVKKQIQAKFIEIWETVIFQTNKWQEYNDCLKKNKIVLLKLSKHQYYDIIYDVMLNVQNKIKGIFTEKVNRLCPLESVILYFMIQQSRNGIYSDLTLNELYHLVDIYSKSFNSNMMGHDECLCYKYFATHSEQTNPKTKRVTQYLMNHFEQIENICKIYVKFIDSHPKVNWLIDHQINFSGNNQDFQIVQKFQLIGYDNDHVFIVYVKPNINNLNCNHLIVDSIFDTFIMNNVRKPFEDIGEETQYNKALKDYEKFGKKQNKTILFTIGQNDFITLEWKLDDQKTIMDLIRKKLNIKYAIDVKYIYYYYKYCKGKSIEQKMTVPEKIIKNAINLFKQDKNSYQLPLFILRFLYQIEHQIVDCRNRKEKQNILDSYDRMDYFLEKLNNLMVQSIDDFFITKWI